MNNKLAKKAKKLASKGYTIIIQTDHSSTGDKIYFAYCLELDGCMAQGKSINEAQKNIDFAIEDFIYFLLEDEMPVPEPSQLESIRVEDPKNLILSVTEESSEFRTIRKEQNLQNSTSIEDIEENKMHIYVYQ